MSFLVAGALQPGNIFRIFGPFQKLLIIFDGNNDSHGFAVPRDDFRLFHNCTHDAVIMQPHNYSGKTFKSPLHGLELL